jgi:hypothetical protein
MRRAGILVVFSVTVPLLAMLVSPQVRRHFAWASGGEPGGTIRGRVVWLAGAGAAGRGQVYLKRISDETERSTTLRPDGGFSFTGLASGEYQLVVIPEGVVPIVRERIVVGREPIDVGLFPAAKYLVCQCPEGPPTTGIRVHLADRNGSRVPHAWIAVDPVGSVRQPGLPPKGMVKSIGPRLHCICYNNPADLGRHETLWLSPGTYTVTAFAVGYTPITVRNVVVESNRLTDVPITWTPSRVPADVLARVLPEQVLTRIDTLRGTLWVALDASWTAKARTFLRRADAHEFDGVYLGQAGPVEALLDADLVPFGYALAMVPVTRGSSLALVQGAGNARQIVGWVVADHREPAPAGAFSPSTWADVMPVLSVARVRTGDP